jgi:signal transduction histidine kinase
VPRPIRCLVAPLADGLTYRRYVHLLLGAVILLPYLGLVALIVSTVAEGGLDLLGVLLVSVPATGIAVGVTLVPGVRSLAITAARTLLGADVPEPDPATVDSWAGRRRAALWLLVNAGAGALAALVTLAVVPTTIGFLFAPWLVLQPFPTGGRAWWLPPVGALLPVVLLHAASAAGAALARLAPRVLGPTRTERMAAELAAAHAAERALAERNRLARELHDSACQQLFSMTLHIRAAQLTTPAGGPAAPVLQTLDQLAHAALADLRALVFELHPTLLHTEGLVAAVREQARSVTKRAGLPVTVDGPDERLPISGDAELDAYRIVQEALHNCVKHAGASAAHVRVGPDPRDRRTLLLEVADDGRGFDPATARTGLGLVSMRERAERLGAELTVTGGPGGTTVRVVAPRVLTRPREDGP